MLETGRVTRASSQTGTWFIISLYLNEDKDVY